MLTTIYTLAIFAACRLYYRRSLAAESRRAVMAERAFVNYISPMRGR